MSSRRLLNRSQGAARSPGPKHPREENESAGLAGGSQDPKRQRPLSERWHDAFAGNPPENSQRMEETQSDNDAFACIPPEIFQKIVAMLSPSELFDTRRVSKDWKVDNAGVYSGRVGKIPDDSKELETMVQAWPDAELKVPASLINETFSGVRVKKLKLLVTQDDVDLGNTFFWLSASGTLVSLDLSRNKLEKLPESIGIVTNITRLVLSRNDLTKLPDAIGNLTSLTELNLDRNDLTKLPVGIPNLTSLKVLNLGHN